jgi:hypothetical protein
MNDKCTLSRLIRQPWNSASRRHREKKNRLHGQPVLSVQALCPDRQLDWTEYVVLSLRNPRVQKRLSGAKLGASGISAAQIAFDDFFMDVIHKRAAKRAGGDAGHTADAPFPIQVNGPGRFIPLEGVEQARFDTGSIVALEAGHRNEFIRRVRDGINAAPARFLILRMREGAGQLAGSAAGTARRNNFETICHRATSFAFSTSPPIF